MWVALFSATILFASGAESLGYDSKMPQEAPPGSLASFGAAVLGSPKPLFCYHLCGLRQRRDGHHPWIRFRHICTCWDTPDTDVHTYETRNCRAALPGENFRSMGQISNCDTAMCTNYLTETNMLDTAVAENALVCEFKQASRNYRFCLCDFKYISNFDNAIGMDDKEEMKLRYKFENSEQNN